MSKNNELIRSLLLACADEAEEHTEDKALHTEDLLISALAHKESIKVFRALAASLRQPTHTGAHEHVVVTRRHPRTKPEHTTPHAGSDPRAGGRPRHERRHDERAHRKTGGFPSTSRCR